MMVLGSQENIGNLRDEYNNFFKKYPNPDTIIYLKNSIADYEGHVAATEPEKHVLERTFLLSIASIYAKKRSIKKVSCIQIKITLQRTFKDKLS